jgi:hypothetical protein
MGTVLCRFQDVSEDIEDHIVIIAGYGSRLPHSFDNSIKLRDGQRLTSPYKKHYFRISEVEKCLSPSWQLVYQRLFVSLPQLLTHAFQQVRDK